MKRARIELRSATAPERAATGRAIDAIVGKHVVRRSRVERAAPARADFESGRVRVLKQEKLTWPDRGGVEWAFEDARKQRA